MKEINNGNAHTMALNYNNEWQIMHTIIKINCTKWISIMKYLKKNWEKNIHKEKSVGLSVTFLYQLID